MTSPLIARTFRVFVSSTFSDLKAERDHLQEHVFPRLRELSEHHGCRFQAIDLRWGVSEEAALDQQTMNICLDELRRCQETSPRPNFIVLLGQRYGWCPLPPQIDAVEFEELLGAVESVEDRVLLCCPELAAEPQPGVHWYRRDDNADPLEYVLRPREIRLPGGASKEQRALIREREAEEWRRLESRMRRILLNAAEELGWPQDDPRRAKYERSATHQEIASGALSPEVEHPEDHVFCFLREVADLPRDLSAAAFIDLDEHGQCDGESAGRLLQLKTTLRDRLREKTQENDGNVHIYPATWTGTGPTTDHLQTLGDDVCGCLSRVILQEVAPVGQPVDDDPETRAHETFGNQRVDVFEGRGDLEGQIRAYIDSAEPHPLVLHGVSGCGKTALVAKAAADATKAAATDAKRKVVCRFIGATPASTSLRSLLEDLCRQIVSREATLPNEIRELGHELSKRLEQVPAERPLVLFLDALDQLGETDGARSLWWLPGTLPANVRLIVSVLDAEGGPGDCYRAAAGRVPASSLVPVGPLATADGERILDQWLGRVGRRLQPEQRADVMAKFSAPGNGLPLYLKLAFEEARRWTSFDGLPRGADAQLGLGTDVPSVLTDLLGRLARDENHGPVFTERALGYLAAGRQGLTEDEIVDVLSHDEEVLRDFQERSPNSPTVSRLPVIVWSRLRAEVEPYLTERHADNTTVLTFYHRQVRDAVEQWCLGGDKGIRAHQKLSEYFGKHEWSLRKRDELPWQLARAREWTQLAHVLADVNYLLVAFAANSSEVRALWAQIEQSSDLRRQEIYAALISDPSTDPVTSVAVLELLPPSITRFKMQAKVSDFHMKYGPSSPAVSLNDLAADLLGRGDRIGASALLEEAERIAKDEGEALVLAHILSNKSNVLFHRGDLAGALDILRDAEKTFKQFDAVGSLASNLKQQARVLEGQGHESGAARALQEAERLWRSLGDHENLARLACEKAISSHLHSDFDDAASLYSEHETVCRRLGLEEELVRSLGNQAVLRLQRGDPTCVRLAEEGLDISTRYELEQARIWVQEIAAVCKRGESPSSEWIRQALR